VNLIAAVTVLVLIILLWTNHRLFSLIPKKYGQVAIALLLLLCSQKDEKT
jgi:hypothetical protein